MVRRHWVRGHFRGGKKAVGGAVFLAGFIIACVLFLVYDSAFSRQHPSFMQWLGIGLLSGAVAASLVGAVWWTVYRWRRTVSIEEARRHRPRYGSARASNHVHVNVTVNGTEARTTTKRRSSNENSEDKVHEDFSG